MYQLSQSTPAGLVIPAFAQKVQFSPNPQPSRYRPVRLLDPESLSGLGQESTTQAAEGAGIAVGAAVGQALIPIPGVGAAIGAVGSLIASLFQPNYNNIKATQDVNSIEPYLQSNLANWLSLSPSQKTTSVQQAALAVYNAAWTQLESLCAQVPGSAGQNCISDRQQGSCAYHVAEPYGWIDGEYVPAGPNIPNGGSVPPDQCWNWYDGYYLPIAQDPNVSADPTGSTSTSATGSTSTSSSSWMLYGAIALAALVALT